MIDEVQLRELIANTEIALATEKKAVVEYAQKDDLPGVRAAIKQIERFDAHLSLMELMLTFNAPLD